MDGIYEVSSSEKVKSLEEDLKKELKELQNEVEEGNFLSSSAAPKAFGSVPLPKDVDHFKRERKLAISKSLQVREAQPLIIQSDVMREEMVSCWQVEYTAKSIPLLLHQFFVDRIEHLVQCKHMHMLRWARFCEHTKAIENLFPVYQKRLSYIMEEYQDCIQRARRLAVACEATLAGSDSAMSVVTMEDLLIYTRWLICMLHSVKNIHAFIRTVEWLPLTHKNTIQPQVAEKEEKPAEQERKPSVGPPSKARGQLKKILSQVSITAHLHVLRPQPTPDASLPPPPPLSLSPYQLVSGTNPSIAAAAAASGGGLASDEINLKLPLHETAFATIKPLLEFLMTCYAVEMDINQINTHADEMDLFTMVSRRFKKVFSKQEQMRTFPVYDASIEEFGDSKIRSEGALHTFKQQSNWTSFNSLRAEQTSTQVKAMTKLKHKGNIDETVLVAQGQGNRCPKKGDIERFDRHNHSIYICWPASECHDGQQLSVEPGSTHPIDTEINCQNCPKNFFSNNRTKKRCRKCTPCGTKEELFPCTSVRDRECANRCISNEHYFNATDEECYPCTECCEGDNMSIEPQCVTMRMGMVIGGRGERHCKRSSKPCEELRQKNLPGTSNCNCTESCNCSLAKVGSTCNCSLSSDVGVKKRELPNHDMPSASKPRTLEREGTRNSIDGLHITLLCLLALCIVVIIYLVWSSTSSENCRFLWLRDLISGSSTLAERTPCLNSCQERLNDIPEEINIDDSLPFDVEEKLIKKLDAKKPHLRNWWHVGRKIEVPRSELDTFKREEDREGGSPTTLLISYLITRENVLSLREFMEVIHCLGRHDICKAIWELYQNQTVTVQTSEL